MGSRHPESHAAKSLARHNEEMIEAGRRPGILARMLGSMLQAAREAAGLSYDAAAARLGCEADWLIRAETGFTVAAPEEVARILAEYGARDAAAAGQMADLARRAAAPPPWLAAHASRLTAANRDVLLIEAESGLARVHGFLLIPELAQTREYFRAISAGAFSERDVEADWDLLARRQAHRPAGLTRMLEVMIDESTLDLRAGDPEVMAGQVRRLLALAGAPHATVRVIPAGAPLWEKRGSNFDVLSLAGTTGRIGVCHYPILGAQIASGDLYDTWPASRAPQRQTPRTAGPSSNATWPPSPERRRPRPCPGPGKCRPTVPTPGCSCPTSHLPPRPRDADPGGSNRREEQPGATSRTVTEKLGSDTRYPPIWTARRGNRGRFCLAQIRLIRATAGRGVAYPGSPSRPWRFPPGQGVIPQVTEHGCDFLKQVRHTGSSAPTLTDHLSPIVQRR